MVINDLDVVNAIWLPPKANTPLIINPDAVPAISIAF